MKQWKRSALGQQGERCRGQRLLVASAAAAVLPEWQREGKKEGGKLEEGKCSGCHRLGPANDAATQHNRALLLRGGRGRSLKGRRRVRRRRDVVATSTLASHPRLRTRSFKNTTCCMHGLHNFHQSKRSNLPQLRFSSSSIWIAQP